MGEPYNMPLALPGIPMGCTLVFVWSPDGIPMGLPYGTPMVLPSAIPMGMS